MNKLPCSDQCLGVDCVCYNGDVTLSVFVPTHCKQCGGAFRDIAGADYSDGLCSVECLKAENAFESAATDEVLKGYNDPSCLDSADDFDGDNGL